MAHQNHSPFPLSSSPCPCGFACSGYFIEIDSYNMAPSVASSTQHNVFQVHPPAATDQHVIPFYGWIIVHSMAIPFKHFFFLKVENGSARAEDWAGEKEAKVSDLDFQFRKNFFKEMPRRYFPCLQRIASKEASEEGDQRFWAEIQRESS